MDTRFYNVLLSMVPGLGPRTLKFLVEYFGSPELAWSADESDLRAANGLSGKIVDNLVNKRRLIKPEMEFEKLKNSGIGLLFKDDDPEYPELLKEIYDPPGVLYYKGSPAVLQSSSFAIVGARKATYYGLSAAESIAGDLSRAGVCVVSGMARGIDAAAHRGALTGAGATAAVLGCGVDVVYPKENKRLMDEIIEKGIVLSEFPPGTSPAAGNFPQRNRIIAGLSQGLMVVEAAEKSGSLITADFALEQGRDVFAVPGLVTSPLNRGAHRLIKQGARLVESAFDILEEMGLNNCFSTSENNILAEKPKITVNDLTSDERRIYNITSDIPISSEVIIQKSGSSAGDVLSILLTMELKGLITQLPGQLYARRRESVRF